MFLKISQYLQIHRKIPVPECLLCCNSIEKRLWYRGFLVNFARFLRTALDDCLYFTTVTGYTLQLYIAGNFQLVRSHWGFRFLFSIFFNFFSFSLTSACLPSQLRKASAVLVLWAVNHFVGSETPKHNDFYQFEKF